MFKLASGVSSGLDTLADTVGQRALDLSKKEIRQSMIGFENVEHRLEHVLTIRGIEFINDSKSTNVNSTWYSLHTMIKPVVWIVGGVDKGNDYTILNELVDKKVLAIIYIGDDVLSEIKIYQHFSGSKSIISTACSMQEAVEMAYAMAEKDQAVLLSPACASFDWFNNYEQRGRVFKSEVRQL